MKYLTYDDNGVATGWYDDAIHQTIPTPNIQVTDEEYRHFYDATVSDKELKVTNGEITIVDRSVPLITWEQIRSERNYLLALCDYTQIPDAELTPEKQLEWKTYRSELRRIPETYATPSDVVWPTPPK